MKSIQFLGDSLKCLREFPIAARHDAGRQLDKVQHGKQPDDFKPMSSIGKGVEEIRIWDDAGTFRVDIHGSTGKYGIRSACLSKENPSYIQEGH